MVKASGLGIEFRVRVCVYGHCKRKKIEHESSVQGTNEKMNVSVLIKVKWNKGVWYSRASSANACTLILSKESSMITGCKHRWQAKLTLVLASPISMLIFFLGFCTYPDSSINSRWFCGNALFYLLEHECMENNKWVRLLSFIMFQVSVYYDS